MSYSLRLCIVLFTLALFACDKKSENYRSTIDLSGTWQFALDTGKHGVEKKWFTTNLIDSIKLPGTTDLSHKGNVNKDTTTLHLNRVYTYEGPAWYKKKLEIPADWTDKHIQLFLERTKSTQVWINDQFIGESFLLQSPQKYDLSSFLSPGTHTLTIRVDNDLKLTPYGNVHIYSDETQTNWNGVLGNIFLEASDKTYITDVQVHPDVDARKAKVYIAVENPLKLSSIDVELQVTKTKDDKTTKLDPATYSVACDSVIVLEYDMGENMDLWDEYNHPVYHLNAIITHEKGKDNLTVPFGMRKFIAKGSQFSINDRITFLRGKHDACVFPLTGHPPMEAEGWIKVFNIAKSYGINHYRFHSWCPLNSAFEAADEVGIYLQPELPFWGGLNSDTTAAKLQAEGLALLKSYANHPSFVLFSPGNEIWGGHERVKKILETLKRSDNRPLYTQGSNNNIGYVGPVEGTDFQVAARTPYSGDTTLTHIRLTHAYVDSKDGGILNTQAPSTNVNFNYSVSQIKIPLVSHEIGQYQIYPDFKEIDKYTGVVRAWNFEVFRKRLAKTGMLDQNAQFTKATGAWSALCYRAEMEAALRTKGFAGFQLLDLQDFPGQGTALVGILDAFMDSKNVIRREEWLQSCNDVVALLEFKKYCWTNAEVFSADVKVANYSNQKITSDITWNVSDEKGTTLSKGNLTPDIDLGGLSDIGKIEIPLKEHEVAKKLLITLSIENSAYKNVYPIWVFPSQKGIPSDNNIQVATTLDKDVLQKLKQGKNILLFPSTKSVSKNSVGGLFPPDFWNYGMFKGISEWAKKPISPGTLGILTEPTHPIFNSFPTDFHTNWQWWSIVRASNPLILDKTNKDYRPIVQVVDNMERNHKLGLIFEFKVGEGKLLVCMSRLNEIADKPEARQLYESIVKYMASGKFNPTYQADEKLLRELSL